MWLQRIGFILLNWISNLSSFPFHCLWLSFKISMQQQTLCLCWITGKKIKTEQKQYFTRSPLMIWCKIVADFLAVFFQLCHGTNENPRTDRLSRAINQQNCQQETEAIQRKLPCYTNPFTCMKAANLLTLCFATSAVNGARSPLCSHSLNISIFQTMKSSRRHM